MGRVNRAQAAQFAVGRESAAMPPVSCSSKNINVK
jgi:hypothetical protein